jgi:hypothetical protein
LYGSLEIVAQGENAPIQLGMEFNTVSWHYLSAPLERFLQTTKTTPDTPEDKTNPLTTQQALERLPLKFSNGLQIYGLLPGEELEEVIFQADTWKRWMYFFRKPVSANTMLLLTSHYMVVITEEMYVKQGWIISYIPRSSIAGMQNRACGLWNELSVQLKGRDQSLNYKLMLKSETVEAWRRQWIQRGCQWQDMPDQQV